MYLKRLKDLRTETSLTQEKIAELLDITRQQYSLYETGRRNIPVEYVKQLAVFYDTSCDYILEITNDPKSYTAKQKRKEA